MAFHLAPYKGRYPALGPQRSTTPDMLSVQRLLAGMRDRGAKAAIVEASTPGLACGRQAPCQSAASSCAPHYTVASGLRKAGCNGGKTAIIKLPPLRWRVADRTAHSSINAKCCCSKASVVLVVIALSTRAAELQGETSDV